MDLPNKANVKIGNATLTAGRGIVLACQQANARSFHAKQSQISAGAHRQ
jgi:hypothetical protein